MKTSVIKFEPHGSITQVSYSRYDKWRKCPRSAYYKFVEKRAEPGSPAMDRGIAIHTLAERYVKKQDAKMPPELKLFAADYKMFRNSGYHAEQEMAFTPDWKPATWFSKVPGLFRAKIDVVSDDLSHIVDTKTGKNRGGYGDQMETYALASYANNTKIEKVKTELLFVDNGEREVAEFTNKEMKKLPAKWTKRFNVMFADTTFTPLENGDCRWCFFRKSNGGPCPINA